MLSDDYSKIVFLRNDRTIEFHAQFGNYDKLRLPKFGRDMTYHPSSCDLFVCGACSDIFRINLEQGQFLSPFLSSLSAINVCDLNPLHSLLIFGGEDGILECWDPRKRNRVGTLDIVPAIAGDISSGADVEITAVKYDIDGLTVGIGTSTGQVLLYDLRSTIPLYKKDHQYGFPIKTIAFLPEKKILSADKKILKIWEREGQMGKIFASVEPPGLINDVCVVQNSGLLLVACEQPKAMTYFIPALGPAPSWCNFLDALTEELEENKQVLYDDFKFVTREDLERLGLAEKLIGTEYLKAYMHGFFIDIRLYNKLKSAIEIETVEYEQYKKDKMKTETDNVAGSRIQAKKKIPKVNAKKATRLLQQKDERIKGLLEDPRFTAMFENKDFEEDEEDEKYKFYHPVESNLITEDDIHQHFDQVDSEEETKVQKDSEHTRVKEKEKEPKKKRKEVNFYEIKPGHELLLNAKKTSSKEKQMPFSKRVKNLPITRVEPRPSGSMEMSFVPESEKEKKRASVVMREEWAKRASQKRGIKDLHLPKQKTRKLR